MSTTTYDDRGTLSRSYIRRVCLSICKGPKDSTSLGSVRDVWGRRRDEEFLLAGDDAVCHRVGSCGILRGLDPSVGNRSLAKLYALMEALWLARDASVTEAKPMTVGIGLGEPVEIPKSLSCASVDKAKVEPNAAHPATTGRLLRGRWETTVEMA